MQDLSLKNREFFSQNEKESRKNSIILGIEKGRDIICTRKGGDKREQGLCLHHPEGKIL
jgi:hypothetical protein